MKTLVLATILFMWAICPSTAQSVQAMVKKQPFPYETGVAMASPTYLAIKAKLSAADSLIYWSSVAVDSLKSEIKAAQVELDVHKDLNRYDTKKAAKDRQTIAEQEKRLKAVEAQLDQAVKAKVKLLSILPRSVRKSLLTATPDQIAQAIVEQVDLLKKRKWKWSAVTLGLGFLSGVFLAL